MTQHVSNREIKRLLDLLAAQTGEVHTTRRRANEAADDRGITAARLHEAGVPYRTLAGVMGVGIARAAQITSRGVESLRKKEEPQS